MPGRPLQLLLELESAMLFHVISTGPDSTNSTWANFFGPGCPTKLGCNTLETLDRSKKIFSTVSGLVDGDRDHGGYRSVVRIRSFEELVIFFGCRRVRFIAIEGDRRLFVHRNN